MQAYQRMAEHNGYAPCLRHANKRRQDAKDHYRSGCFASQTGLCPRPPAYRLFFTAHDVGVYTGQEGTQTIKHASPGCKQGIPPLFSGRILKDQGEKKPFLGTVQWKNKGVTGAMFAVFVKRGV